MPAKIIATVRPFQLLLFSTATLCGCRVFSGRTLKLETFPRSRGSAAESLQEVLTLEEHEIDVGRAALLAARDERPELDISSYLARLDELAAELARRLPKGISARRAAEEFARFARMVLTRKTGRAAAHLTEASAGSLPPEMDIAYILDGGRANCLGATLLCLAIAERVGLPIVGVAAPEHYFVRFDDGTIQLNMELTRGARFVSDREYIRERRISPEAIERGIYLRSESKRQTLASLLANRAGCRAIAGKLEAALEDAERALAVKPYWPQAHVNKGLALELAGKTRQAEESYLRALELDHQCASALNNLAVLYLKRVKEAAPSERTDAPAMLQTAFKMAEKAVRLAPSRPEFCETAASCAAELGELRAARSYLRRAMQLAPKNPAYLEILRRLSDD